MPPITFKNVGQIDFKGANALSVDALSSLKDGLNNITGVVKERGTAQNLKNTLAVKKARISTLSSEDAVKLIQAGGLDPSTLPSNIDMSALNKALNSQPKLARDNIVAQQHFRDAQSNRSFGKKDVSSIVDSFFPPPSDASSASSFPPDTSNISPGTGFTDVLPQTPGDKTGVLNLPVSPNIGDASTPPTDTPNIPGTPPTDTPNIPGTPPTDTPNIPGTPPTENFFSPENLLRKVEGSSMYINATPEQKRIILEGVATKVQNKEKSILDSLNSEALSVKDFGGYDQLIKKAAGSGLTRGAFLSFQRDIEKLKTNFGKKITDETTVQRNISDAKNGSLISRYTGEINSLSTAADIPKLKDKINRDGNLTSRQQSQLVKELNGQRNAITDREKSNSQATTATIFKKVAEDITNEKEKQLNINDESIKKAIDSFGKMPNGEIIKILSAVKDPNTLKSRLASLRETPLFKSVDAIEQAKQIKLVKDAFKTSHIIPKENQDEINRIVQNKVAPYVAKLNETKRQLEILGTKETPNEPETRDQKLSTITAILTKENGIGTNTAKKVADTLLSNPDLLNASGADLRFAIQRALGNTSIFSFRGPERLVKSIVSLFKSNNFEQNRIAAQRKDLERQAAIAQNILDSKINTFTKQEKNKYYKGTGVDVPTPGIQKKEALLEKIRKHKLRLVESDRIQIEKDKKDTENIISEAARRNNLGVHGREIEDSKNNFTKVTKSLELNPRESSVASRLLEQQVINSVKRTSFNKTDSEIVKEALKRMRLPPRMNPLNDLPKLNRAALQVVVAQRSASFFKFMKENLFDRQKFDSKKNSIHAVGSKGQHLFRSSSPNLILDVPHINEDVLAEGLRVFNIDKSDPNYKPVIDQLKKIMSKLAKSSLLESFRKRLIPNSTQK